MVQISELQLTYLAFDVLYYKVRLAFPHPVVRSCNMQPGMTNAPSSAQIVWTPPAGQKVTRRPFLLHQDPTDPTDCPDPHKLCPQAQDQSVINRPLQERQQLLREAIRPAPPEGYSVGMLQQPIC